MSFTLRIDERLYKNLPPNRRKPTLKLFNDAVLLGIQSGLHSYISRVARKTGALRIALRRGFLIQARQSDVKSVNIKFPYAYLGAVPFSNGKAYAQYHIIDWNLNRYFSRGGYKRPSTAGTRPIDVQECLGFILRGIKREIEKTFQNQNTILLLLLQLNIQNIINIRGNLLNVS